MSNIKDLFEYVGFFLLITLALILFFIIVFSPVALVLYFNGLDISNYNKLELTLFILSQLWIFACGLQGGSNDSIGY